jgi:hypothetical protein
VKATFYKGVVLGAATSAVVLAAAAALAATGGNFILGQSNTAESTSGLSANLASGPSLTISNLGGGPAASFATLGKTAPFTVSSKGKVVSLNADMVDGKHASAFLSVSGKAADADKLDGLDSSAFVQGSGRVLAARLNMSVGDPDTTLLDLGFARLDFHCESDIPNVLVTNTSSQTMLVSAIGENNDGIFARLAPGEQRAITNGFGGAGFRGAMTIGEGTGGTTVVASVELAWTQCESQAIATIKTG